MNTRLAELESVVQDHRHKLKAFNRKAEDVHPPKRKARQLDLVLYNFPEEAEQEKDDNAIAASVGRVKNPAGNYLGD